MDYRPQTRVFDLHPASYISYLKSIVYSLKPIVLLCLVIFHFGSLSSAMGYMLSVGHLPPLRNGRTVLLITDLSGSGPAVTIRFHDDLGRQVPASPVHKLLPPRGKIQIDVEDYLQTAGTIILESSSEQVVGEYWQTSENGAIFALPFQHSGVEERYFVNCFRFPSCEDNYLVLSDPSGSGPLAQMEFYNKPGELVKVPKKLLRPYSTLAYAMDNYTSWDTLGKVSVRSFGGSMVLHYRQLCDNGAILAVPARSPAKELFIDEFSVDRDITGNLVIVDTSAEGPAIKVLFRDSDGTVLGDELEKLLPPNGTVLIEPADYVDNISRGTISISSDSEVIADYWEKDSSAVFNIPAVDKPGSILLISHFLPFDNTQNLLSLLNVGQESVRVTVQFYAVNGREIGVEEFLLEPYKRIDELVGRYFDGASLGTIIVRSPKASLVVSSHISGIEDHRLLGKIHAQVIR